MKRFHLVIVAALVSSVALIRTLLYNGIKAPEAWPSWSEDIMSKQACPQQQAERALLYYYSKNSASHSNSNNNSASDINNKVAVTTTNRIQSCSWWTIRRHVSRFCPYFAGRHNLKYVWMLIRYHLPQAQILVDIGANKGLVSARWLDLYKPTLNITGYQYAHDIVRHYMDRNNQSSSGHWCGVTNMCETHNTLEHQLLDRCASRTSSIRDHPVSSKQDNNNGEEDDPFIVYSFEPSQPLYLMHQEFQTNHILSSNALRRHWKWRTEAVSDFIGNVCMDFQWNEGSSIVAKGKKPPPCLSPNVKCITLDELAYGDEKLFGDQGILDIVKIDAESVDAKVVVGAARLLASNRIRVITWETPNLFPLSFPDWFGGNCSNFGDLISKLDQYANMACYFPGHSDKVVRIGNCWDQIESMMCPGNDFCPYDSCPIHHSNALCISRTLAPSLYHALEAQVIL